MISCAELYLYSDLHVWELSNSMQNTSEDHSSPVFFCYSMFENEGEHVNSMITWGKKKKPTHSHKTAKSWNEEGCIKKTLYKIICMCGSVFACVCMSG